jgi:hypothetical protein
MITEQKVFRFIKKYFCSLQPQFNEDFTECIGIRFKPDVVKENIIKDKIRSRSTIQDDEYITKNYYHLLMLEFIRLFDDCDYNKIFFTYLLHSSDEI